MFVELILLCDVLRHKHNERLCIENNNKNKNDNNLFVKYLRSVYKSKHQENFLS